MISAKHREELIRRLNSIEDKRVLDEIYRLLNMEFDDDIYFLSSDQKKDIELAKGQLEEGKSISSETLNQELNEWLKK
jgi:hypothetical protein